MADSTSKKKGVDYIKIEIATGTTRKLVASWTNYPKFEHTKAFDYEWRYKTANGSWQSGESGTTKEYSLYDENGHKSKVTKQSEIDKQWKNLVKTVTWDAPDEAVEVGFRIRRVPDKYKSDDEEKFYYTTPNWTSWKPFSAWAKTTTPTALQFKETTSKSKGDELYIKYNDSGINPNCIRGQFVFSKSKHEQFLPYLTGIRFQWEAYDGSVWTNVDAFETYIHYTNDSDGRTAVGSGLIHSGNEITVSDQVKAAIRANASGFDIRLNSYVHPVASVRSYRFSVEPISNNQYAFQPVVSMTTFDYQAKPLRMGKNGTGFDIDFEMDTSTFIVSWTTQNIDTYSEEIGHVTGFDIEWQYVKDSVRLYNAAGETYYDGENIWSATNSGSVELDSRESYSWTEYKTSTTTINSGVDGQSSTAQQFFDPQASAGTSTSTVWDPVTNGTTQIKSKTKAIDYTSYTWTYRFQLPQGVRVDTPVRVRMKVRGDGSQSFIETWGDWVEYTGTNLERRSVGQITITAPTASARRLDAEWTIEDPLLVSGFSYTWYYCYANDVGTWREGQSGTVDITRTKSGVRLIEDILSQRNFSWMCSYDAPAEAYGVQCEVKPIPTYEGAFEGDAFWAWYAISVPIKTVPIGTVSILLSDPVNRILEARWGEPTDYQPVTPYSPAGSVDVLSGYQYVWEYYKDDYWYNAQTSSASAGFVIDPSSFVSTNYAQYTVPDDSKIKMVRFAVRPTPSNPDYFAGAWSGYCYINIDPILFKLSADRLKIQPLENEPGTLLATYENAMMSVPSEGWNYDTQIENRQLIFEWAYERNGLLLDPTQTSTRLDFPYSTFQIPGDNDWQPECVLVRVKPDFRTLEYVAQWSSWVQYNIKRPIYRITDLDAELFDAASRTVLGSWKANDAPGEIASYSYQWRYYKNGRWLSPSGGDTEYSDIADDNVATYDVPEGSGRVSFRVKPNPKNEIDFKGEWSNLVLVDVPDDVIPDVLGAPTLTVLADGYTVRATIEAYDNRISDVEFMVVDREGNTRYGQAEMVANVATWQFTGAGGRVYKGRVRALNSRGQYRTPEPGDTVSDPQGWSNWSSEVGTRPAPVKITSCQGLTATSIKVDWADTGEMTGLTNATSYIVERTTKAQYFDAASNEVTSTTVTASNGGYAPKTLIVTGLTEGATWYFRVAAVRQESGTNLQSEWSNIESCTIGKKPTAPTTWSNRTTAMINEPVILYWTHNSEDNSSEKTARLEIKKNGTTTTLDLPNDEDNTTQRSYTLPASYRNSECTIQWRVRTKGAYGTAPSGTPSSAFIEQYYSPWSTQRIVNIYTAPTLTLSLLGSSAWNWDTFNENSSGVYTNLTGITALTRNIMTGFPLFIKFTAGPVSQTPVAYSLTITANNGYSGHDDVGNEVAVLAGQVVYQRYYNTSNRTFTTLIMPGDADLISSVSYTVNVTVAMDSGLSASARAVFSTSWDVEEHTIDAALAIDKRRAIAYVTPYCQNQNGVYSKDITLSLFRREFDGGFTKVADNISNKVRPTITDPHPSLDYARYRIVAINKRNGAVEFIDLVPQYIGLKCIIIQWDEKCSWYLDDSSPDPLAIAPWSGSMVCLPYNIDTTDTNTTDVEMVEYIGRSHPVSYYGTQVGQKATWTALIPKTDKQTIYDLRRLARYMGNVYVREPSGTGYWAHVEVTFSMTHLETTIPVNLSITRVEGGM